MPIRVLQIIGSMHFGGAEKVVMHLVNHADPVAFASSVCCTRFVGSLGEKLQQQGIEVCLTAPRRHAHALRYFSPVKVLAEVLRLRPDIVHTHGIEAIGIVGPLAYARLIPPWIHTFHYGNYPYMNERWMWFERVFSRHADRLIAVSNAQRESIVRFHHLKHSRISTIPNGVMRSELRRDTGSAINLRRSLGIADGKVVVGTVAVLTEQKGIKFLLDAAAQITARYPSVHFLIVGGGPIEASLREKAQALRISEVVTFTGWREDVAEILPVLDIYVMSSLWEAMPLALLEAMATARPIVVTDVSDNAIVIEHGKSGIVVPPGDADSLAAAISSLLDDPERSFRFGENARLRFEERYSVERMVHEYERLYKELAAAR